MNFLISHGFIWQNLLITTHLVSNNENHLQGILEETIDPDRYAIPFVAEKEADYLLENQENPCSKSFPIKNEIIIVVKKQHKNRAVQKSNMQQ